MVVWWYGGVVPSFPYRFPCFIVCVCVCVVCDFVCVELLCNSATVRTVVVCCGCKFFVNLLDKGLWRYFVFLEKFLEHKSGVVKVPICFLKASVKQTKD